VRHYLRAKLAATRRIRLWKRCIYMYIYVCVVYIYICGYMYINVYVYVCVYLYMCMHILSMRITCRVIRVNSALQQNIYVHIHD